MTTTSYTANTLEELKTILNGMPDGTACDTRDDDLETGNFSTAFFIMPDGNLVQLTYTGQVATREWEPWEAYTTGNRKEIGVARLSLEHHAPAGELLNDGSTREYISVIMGDGKHFIFRPIDPNYEEIKQRAQ